MKASIVHHPTCIVWCTDNGAVEGIHGPEYSTSLSSRIHVIVFQAEIQAIGVWLQENRRKGYRGKIIYIFFDSQTTVNAWKCLGCLLTIASNNIALTWVP